LIYKLPKATDPDDTALLIALVSGPNFASFSVSKNEITFNPTAGSAGTYLVTLSITDGVNEPQFTFNVIVTANSPAIFVSTPVDKSTPANSPISYTLPETSDAESNTVTIGLTAGGPTFVSLTQPNILQISPGLLDVGTYSV
jgi:Bacterial Ig domain